MPGISSDDLGSMVESVTKGAIAGLGEVSESDSSLNLSDLVSEVSSSATESLGEIEMPGFSAENLVKCWKVLVKVLVRDWRI